MTYDWSGTHAKQPELKAYAQAVIDRFKIADHFCYLGLQGTHALVWLTSRYAMLALQLNVFRVEPQVD